MKEFNFIKNTLESDKELFFGPLADEDKFIHIDDNMNMAHIMFTAGIFSSVSQARKNIKNIEIPSGFTDFFAGKLRTRITILNII
jgi:hypothetical protein